MSDGRAAALTLCRCDRCRAPVYRCVEGCGVEVEGPTDRCEECQADAERPVTLDDTREESEGTR